MGSMICLSVGRLEIESHHSNNFFDHRAVFQSSDITQVPYYYVNDSASEQSENSEEASLNIITENKEGLSKPLFEVVDRISLLGFTPNYAEKQFNLLSESSFFDYRFTFEELSKAFAEIDASFLSLDCRNDSRSFGDFICEEIFPRLGINDIYEPSYVHPFKNEDIDNMQTYTIIHLLASNQTARHLPVIWSFKDVENDGYAKQSDFVKPLDQSDRFLIVTEGSSDALIIRHAFKLLKPHIADFFDFVDMQGGYPFSGTGNLVKFVKGLISISIQNNTVVIFDNDAEGLANFNRCLELNIPQNMNILRLPDLPDFDMVKTSGPNGNHIANINRRAAAIECYLDIGDDACVRWSNYNSATETYQGELINKEQYKRNFLDQSTTVSSYRYDKIEKVLDMIIQSCVQMKEKILVNRLYKHGPCK